MTLTARAILAALAAFFVVPAGAVLAAGTAGSVHDFRMQDIDGKPVALDQYRGRVILIVNVASRCGYTYQYDGLEALYRQYKDRGLVILGFPSNDFLGQEPGTNQEIKQFCAATYGVSFPMFSKITVRGAGMDPLYRFLTDKATNPRFSGPISWNFNKFLIGRDGAVLARFRTQDEPKSTAVIQAVEAALGS